MSALQDALRYRVSEKTIVGHVSIYCEEVNFKASFQTQNSYKLVRYWKDCCLHALDKLSLPVMLALYLLRGFRYVTRADN